MSDDGERIRSVVVGVVHHVDRKQWAALRALYTDQVETDYTSLFGGTPQGTPADDLIEGFRSRLASVVTHHLLGPIEVEGAGDQAEARCHVRALHFAEGAPSGETWEVLGHYVFGLHRQSSGWKIARMKLEALHQLGNRQLLEESAAG